MDNKTFTHTDLCIATAKQFIKKIALYEYKSITSFSEQPDVLVYDESQTMLFEIKMSLSDFNADKYKLCRRKYSVPHYAYHVHDPQEGKEKKIRLKFHGGGVEIDLIENRHLGNLRYFICPADVIPVDKVPEGWGLFYYKNGKFYWKKQSSRFRSNLKKENALIVHALRRFASGDTTGIMVNTYEYKGKRRVSF
jgi:hypothetical protein